MPDLIDVKWKQKTENICKDNSDKPYLLSFMNYLELAWTTKHNYISHVTNFMEYCGNKQLEKLTLDDYTNYMAQIEGTSSYRTCVYHALKNFSEWLYKTKKNPEHYMENMKRPKQIESVETKKKRDMGYLEKDEITQILDAVRNSYAKNSIRDYALISLALCTGLRESAIWSLNVDSIDYETGDVVAREKEGIVRTVYLHEDALHAVKNWLRLRDNYFTKASTTDDQQALFISNRGFRMNEVSIYRTVKKYGSVVKGKNITPHKLRATFVTQVYDKTKDVYLAQQMAGHRSPVTTERYIRGREKKNAEITKNLMRELMK